MTNMNLRHRAYSDQPRTLVLSTKKAGKHSEPLRECVRDAMERYFRQLDGHDASGLFEMVMKEVEEPLLESVMDHAKGNQTRASEILGISRSTLRKKLAKYHLIKM